MATRRINSDVLCLSILRRERKLLLTNERSSLCSVAASTTAATLRPLQPSNRSCQTPGYHADASRAGSSVPVHRIEPLVTAAHRPRSRRTSLRLLQSREQLHGWPCAWTGPGRGPPPKVLAVDDALGAQARRGRGDTARSR